MGRHVNIFVTILVISFLIIQSAIAGSSEESFGTPVSVTVTSLEGGEFNDMVPIEFELADSDADLCTVQYYIGFGEDEPTAWTYSGWDSLPSSLDGMTWKRNYYTLSGYLWPVGAVDYPYAWIKVTAEDDEGASEAVTGPFALNNAVREWLTDLEVDPEPLVLGEPFDANLTLHLMNYAGAIVPTSPDINGWSSVVVLINDRVIWWGEDGLYNPGAGYDTRSIDLSRFWSPDERVIPEDLEPASEYILTIKVEPYYYYCNNVAEISQKVEIHDPVVAIEIDIKPGTDDNCINLGSGGYLPVAILGSDTFDVMNVDQGTIEFAGCAARAKGKKGKRGSFSDVNEDGYIDIVVHFWVQELALTPSDLAATLSGELKDGTIIEGTDVIQVVP